MKKLYFLLVVAVLSFTSCHNDIWNSINDLDSRVKALEELCREMNTNINSLQSLIEVIQSGDYITNIVPITKGGEVIGYTITFKNHEPITIFNGEDGATANIPVIGAAQDTDGVYYWTVNGEWLLDDNGNKIRVTGRDGQNGQDGQNGSDGQPGQPGNNGQDGITPLLKIENGMWYVSYNNGQTWTMLGQATGDQGQDGDNIFTSVTYDNTNVYFVLSDGTILCIPFCCCTSTNDTVSIVNGAIIAPFSVNSRRTVYFSKGNLMYSSVGNHISTFEIVDTILQGTWKFAEKQWMVQGQNNELMDSAYTGWIDLFLNGSSGYSNPPYSSQSYWTGSVLYWPDYRYNWGEFNPISNDGWNTPGMWTVLSEDEWHYILSGRPGANRLSFIASVEDVWGLVLLPDSWNDVSLRYNLNGIGNDYSEAMWREFEKKGAIFLPEVGGFNESDKTWQNVSGYYWMGDGGWNTTPSSNNLRACVCIDRANKFSYSTLRVSQSRAAVRLVTDSQRFQ